VLFVVSCNPDVRKPSAGYPVFYIPASSLLQNQVDQAQRLEKLSSTEGEIKLVPASPENNFLRGEGVNVRYVTLA